MNENNFEFGHEHKTKGLLVKFKQSIFFLPAVVTLSVGLVTFFLMQTSPEVVEETNEFPPLVVEVSEASLDQQLRVSRFQGAARAKTEIELVTQVAGRVESVSERFIEGGEFAANEAILQIEQSDFKVALKLAEASVAEAKVELDIELASAETNKKEWRDLVGEKIENANPLRLNQPQVQRAEARLDAAKAQLAKAQLDLDRTTISAPFAGRIKSKSAELGQFMPRGSSVGRVFSTDSVEIRISMTDTQITELGLTLGQLPVGQTLKAKVTARFGKGLHEWQGYLKSVDASVDSETRLLFGTIVVDSPFDLESKTAIPLAPGLYVDVELDAVEKVAGISVPRSALRNGTRVYVVQDNVLSFREVDTIFTSAEIAVLSASDNPSVLAGDKVVISPVPGAYDGMQVEMKSGQEQLSDVVEPAVDPVDIGSDEKATASAI